MTTAIRYNNMSDLPNLVVEGFLYLLLLLYLLNEFRELYGIIKVIRRDIAEMTH